MENLSKVNIKCQKCNKHKADAVWVGDGGMLAAVHGHQEIWCKCCVLKTQIDSLEKMIKRLNVLKNKLKDINCK